MKVYIILNIPKSALLFSRLEDKYKFYCSMDGSINESTCYELVRVSLPNSLEKVEFSTSDFSIIDVKRFFNIDFEVTFELEYVFYTLDNTKSASFPVGELYYPCFYSTADNQLVRQLVI